MQADRNQNNSFIRFGKHTTFLLWNPHWRNASDKLKINCNNETSVKR